MKRRPWFFIPAGPVGWQSHDFIYAALKGMMKRMGARIQPIWFPKPAIPTELAAEIRRTASCLVFPLNADGEALWFLSELRERHRVRVPAVLMLAGEFTTGGYSIISQRKGLRAADHFVVNCSVELQLARAAFSENTNIHRIPLCIPPVRSSIFGAAARSRLRAELGVRPREKMFVYGGRISAQKNVHGLLHAFAEARKADRNLKLFLLGAADDIGAPQVGISPIHRYRHRISEIVCEKGLEDSVRFEGMVPREVLYRYFAACDANVSLTVNFEDFGYAIAEGLACGAPTMITRWGGGLDVVDAGAALGVPVEVSLDGPRVNYRVASEAMVRLGAGRERTHWSKSAAAYAREELSEKKVAERWRALFEEIADSRYDDSPVSFSDPFMKFHFDSVVAQHDRLNRYLEVGIAAFFNWFGTPKHPLYQAIATTYAGGTATPRGHKAYLHPYFSLDSGRVDDPLHSPALKLRIRPEWLREARRAFSRARGGVVRWDSIESKSWAKNLNAAGIILRSDV